MDSVHSPYEGPGLPVQGPHWTVHPEEASDLAPVEAPVEFYALRLVLQPTGAAVEVNRSEMILGRHSDADIRLPMPDVSRRHCRLQFVEGTWQVVDLHSLNGVFVNGEQVYQTPLDHGDLLRVGGFTFSVELLHEHVESHVHSFIKSLTQPQPHRKAS